MIDAGGSIDDSYDVGKNILHRYLLNKGINKLDYIMLTHFDLDHCGGAIFLMKNMKVKNLIISKQPEETEAYKNITAIAKQKDIKIIYVKKYDKLKIKDLQIEIFNPDDNFIIDNPLNNNAIVCKISYEKFKMLFTGDIEEIAEQKLINEDLQADVLKVGHHGSKTSTSQEFLNKINPKVALIGVGENNKFGHPSNEVIQRLKNKNIKIFRTDLNGEITIKFSKNDYKIEKFIN